MPTKDLYPKLLEVFKKIPNAADQKRALENLTIWLQSRLDEDNKSLQEQIAQNNKLKE